jgi:hypothetical protein
MSSFAPTELLKEGLAAGEMVGEWKVVEDLKDMHRNRRSFIEFVKGEIISLVNGSPLFSVIVSIAAHAGISTTWP